MLPIHTTSPQLQPGGTGNSTGTTGAPGTATQAGQSGTPGAGVAAGAGFTTSFDSTPAAGVSPNSANGATYITGAYQPSGNAVIDRMLQLEAALKRFGTVA